MTPTSNGDGDGLRDRLSSSRMTDSVDLMNDTLQHMEEAVESCWVDGGESKSQASIETRAWGVWVRKPRAHAGNPAQKAAEGTAANHEPFKPTARRGQHGLLGTAAGLELMASRLHFRDDIASRERRDLLAGAWLFLRDSVEELPGPADGVPAEAKPPTIDERRTLLIRQTQMLRALAALEGHMSEIVPRESPWLTAETNLKLAREVLAELLKCKEASIALTNLPGQCAATVNFEAIPGFRFTSTPGSGEPETPNEWAYLLGSAIVAIVRCCESGLLRATKLESYVTPADVSNLAQWTLKAVDSDNIDTVRVGLYAGWSLLQMDGLFAPKSSPPQVGLHTGARGRIQDPAAHNVRLKLDARMRSALPALIAPSGDISRD